MKFQRITGATLTLIGVAACAWACSSQSSDCNANLTCGSPNAGTGGGSGSSNGGRSGNSSGGNSASGGRAGGSGQPNAGRSGNDGESGSSGEAGSAGSAPVPSCDSTLSPDADSCVISDEVGVFVSPQGSDADGAGDGTKALPFATVTKALSALSEHKRIYVCAADYTEPATLELPDALQVYGGFSCKGGAWNYDAPIKAHLVSASPIGATIDSATVGVTLQDIRLDAANAPDNGTGSSSFGLIVNASKNVVLTRVELRAGKGGLGKNGEDGASGLDGLPSGSAQNGKAAECSTATASLSGGAGLPIQCGSQGGDGGKGLKGDQASGIRDGGPGFPGAVNGGTAGTVFGQNTKAGDLGSNGDSDPLVPRRRGSESSRGVDTPKQMEGTAPQVYPVKAEAVAGRA